jgi:AdoMet-dependent heme synthase
MGGTILWKVNKMKSVIQIMWHVNNECNFRCSHCYEENYEPKPVDRWDFQSLAIDRITELQSQYELIRVGLLGGEPLLDPNIIKIVKTLYNKGVKRVDISTNGALADLNLVKNLKKANITMVQVSLEGPIAEINDVIRGKGSFDKAVRGLRILKESGISTGIMMTVSKFNLQFVEEMVEFALREGVDIVSFNRMLPLGRGKRRMTTVLEPKEVMQMINMVHLLDKKHKTNIDVSSDDPLLYVPMNGNKYTSNEHGGCGAGIGSLAIFYDGTVFPCRRLPIAVGNIVDSSLIEIINSSSLDCFYEREEYLEGKCSTCDHRQICGGCRASAYAFTGDYLNADPQCWLNTK